MKPKIIKPSQVSTDYVELLCSECGDQVYDITIGGSSLCEVNSPSKLVCNNLDCSAEYKWPENLTWIKPVFKRKF